MLMEIGAVVLGCTVWTHVRSLPPIQGVQQPGEGWKLLDVWDKRPATYASCSQKEMGVGACSRFLLRKAAERRIRGRFRGRSAGGFCRRQRKPSLVATRFAHTIKRKGAGQTGDRCCSTTWRRAISGCMLRLRPRGMARLDGVTDPFRGFGGQCSQQ
jgi:hypothetical protein